MKRILTLGVLALLLTAGLSTPVFAESDGAASGSKCGTTAPAAASVTAGTASASELAGNALVIQLATENWKKASKAVDKALAQKEGISSFQAIEGSNIVRVMFDPSVTTKDKVLAMVSDAGEGTYTATTPKLFLKTIKVDGMTCGGCARQVKGALSAVEQVGLVVVDLEKGQAHLLTLQDDFNFDKANAAVTEAGFKYAGIVAGEAEEKKADSGA